MYVRAWLRCHVAWIEPTQGLGALSLDFGVSPTRNLNVVVDDLLVVLVGVQGDVVPEGNGVAILLKPDAPILECVSHGMYETTCQWLLTNVFRAPTSLRLTES
jgi:hypothetical protein